MNTTKRFDNAISALVNAFIKGTLGKNSCCACAVGNMVASGLGVKVVKDEYNLFWEDGQHTAWPNVFITPCTGAKQQINPGEYFGHAKRQIDATGYSWQELALVEAAFESATKIGHLGYWQHSPEEVDADQLAGLMAVVDVLCQIEGITDPAPYKAQFDKSLPLEIA